MKKLIYLLQVKNDGVWIKYYCDQWRFLTAGKISKYTFTKIRKSILEEKSKQVKLF